MKRALVGLVVVLALVMAWFRADTRPSDSSSAGTTAQSAPPKSPPVPFVAPSRATQRSQAARVTPETGSMQLTVVDATTEHPLEGVTVDVHHGCFESSIPVATARTDTNGRVNIGGLSVGALNVSLSLDGFDRDDCIEVQLPVDATLRLTRLVPFRGQVLMPDGRPASGAEVIPERARPRRAAVDGTFEVFSSSEHQRICARLGALSIDGSLSEFQNGLSLRDAGVLRTRVVDEDGAPVAGVRIFRRRFSGEPVAVSDADGGVSFSDVCDEIFVELEREGFARTMVQPILDKPLVIEHPLEASIRGTVVDDKALPVAGAFVTLESGDHATLTGADGRFEFVDVARFATVRATQGARRAVHELNLGRGETAELTLNLGAPSVRIAFEVVVDGHVSEAPWRITIRQLDGPFSEVVAWRAGGNTHDARYETTLALPSGRFSLNATRADGDTGSGQTEVRIDVSAPPNVLQIYASEKPE